MYVIARFNLWCHGFMVYIFDSILFVCLFIPFFFCNYHAILSSSVVITVLQTPKNEWIRQKSVDGKINRIAIYDISIVDIQAMQSIKYSDFLINMKYFSFFVANTEQIKKQNKIRRETTKHRKKWPNYEKKENKARTHHWNSQHLTLNTRSTIRISQWLRLIKLQICE